jgi:hypothetical protein
VIANQSELFAAEGRGDPALVLKRVLQRHVTEADDEIRLRHGLL